MHRITQIRKFLPMYLTAVIGLILFAILSSKATTTLAESAPLQARHCVIIDAGHGGIDGGATSCTGVLESKINLEIATRLNDLIHLLGLDTIMMRTSDQSMHTEDGSIAQIKISDLKQRVRIVNGTENCILVSIHQNYFTDSRYSGAQVFYAKTTNSDVLARQLQSDIVQVINQGSNRKAKRASGIYLLEKINCTGILVECGFLSNPQEEAKLLSAEYQKELCSVIAVTLVDFLNQNKAA